MFSLSLNRNKPLIMHIDLNSCFATVDQQAHPHFRGKPLVVAAYATPNGCVLSPSIEAKRYGIKTGHTVREAKMRYTNVIVRTVDTALVRDVHVRFKRIFCDYSPHVTPKSIDEAVLDFSNMEYILKTSLEDIAREIKQRMRTEIGEWISCSVGIGTNRFLAKMGASLIKPDGLVTVTHENLRSIYQKLELMDLNGINVRTQARLNSHGIFTPLQLLDAELPLLKNQVFKSIGGYYWYMRLRGWETDAIDFARKSFGQQYAMGEKTSDPEKLAKILMKLVEKMGRRLRRHGMAARGVHIACLYEDYTHWHKGKKFDREMITSAELFRKALYVLNQQPERKVVTRLAVSCYDLTPSQNAQVSLFDFDPEKQRKISEAMDKINDTYGEFTITPALMMGTSHHAKDTIAFGGVKEVEDLYM